MTTQDVVAYASLLAGALCFILYLALSIAALISRPAAAAKSFHAEAKALIKTQAVSIGELTDLLKAVAQVSDSLSKAAPSLVALIGSILFLTIASIASGALHGAPPPVAAKTAPDNGKGDATAPPQQAPKSGD